MAINRETFFRWFGGPLIHVHLQLDGNIVSDSIERHQFTEKGIVRYLAKISNRKQVLVSDTNHAMIGIYRDRGNWKKGEEESLEEYNQRRIAYSSDELEKRCFILKSTPGILTGVETDIISPRGEMTTPNDLLDKLDVVIASLHWRTWVGFQGGDSTPAENKKKILEAYASVAENPRIDVLGHPTVFPETIREVMVGEDYRRIFELMRERNLALEVNLSVDMNGPQSRLEKEMLRVAADTGVPIALGADIHHLEYYNFPGFFTNYITRDNWQDAFKYHQESGWNFYLFRFMARSIRTLESAGISSEQIVNGSDNNFQQWQRKRINLE